VSNNVLQENFDQSRDQAFIDADNPWPGLDYFTEDAARFFNGRERESLLLLNRIVDAPLTILFGKSGLGKTSLLQAGLFPKLRKLKIQPIYIRLDFSNHAPSPVAQVALRFKEELSRQKVEAPAFKPDETLWEYLHRRNLELWSHDNWQTTPLLVFDQFEEVHTLVRYKDRDAITHLKSFLAELIENRVPAALDRQIESDTRLIQKFDFRSQRLKILLSFREDFLAHFETWKTDIPSLMQNRVRMEPMTYHQAIDAIFKTGSVNKLVSHEVAEKIVHLVEHSTTEIETKIDSGGGNVLVRYATIEPTILSLICRGLNEARKQRRKSEIDASLLSEEKSQPKAIVEEFYEHAVKDLPDSDNIKKFIEDELITSHGYRKRCSKDDALNRGVSEAVLRELENRRLLHHIASEQVSWYELTHDLLTSVVVRSRKERAKKEQLQQEQEKLQEKAEHFRHLSEQRARMVRNMIVISLLLLGALIFAGYERLEAERSRDSAEKAKNIAEANRRLADDARMQAETAQRVAEKRNMQYLVASKRISELNKEIQTLVGQTKLATQKNSKLAQALNEVKKLNQKIQEIQQNPKPSQ